MFAVALDEPVAVHVAADQPGAVREAVREARVRRQQQQMRAPAVARRDDERLRAVLDRIARADPGAPPAPRRSVERCVVEDQPADQRPIVQHDLLRRDQLLEREVRRVARARRADLAAGVVDAAAAAAAERRQVARHRQRRELDAALLGPRLQRLQVVGQRDRALRIRLRPPILGMRARLAADVQPPLRLAVVASRARATRSASRWPGRTSTSAADPPRRSGCTRRPSAAPGRRPPSSSR